jgi:hypothetical protein
MNGLRPRTQFARLVVHADCDAADLLFVPTRVMGAEQQFTAARIEAESASTEDPSFEGPLPAPSA